VLAFLGIVPMAIPLPMYLLGCIVVIVQTLVFCLLSTIYISMAIAHEH
jgi:F-type H+-transporting ATPase subunit a